MTDSKLIAKLAEALGWDMDDECSDAFLYNNQIVGSFYRNKKWWIASHEEGDAVFDPLHKSAHARLAIELLLQKLKGA